jgi:hypothetical protein
VPEFSNAVEAISRTMAEAGGDDYLADAGRLREAEAVAPCVERFVYGELDPSRKLSASRTSLPGSPPSLAEKLGRKFSDASADTLAGLQSAVRRAIAVGYVFYGPVEIDNSLTYAEGRAPEDVWDFWAPSCREMLEETGMPKSVAKIVRDTGSNVFISDLKTVGVTKFLGGSKLNQLGMVYAQAGVLLRMTQTSAITDEHFVKTVRSVRDRPDRRWKWDDYPL